MDHVTLRAPGLQGTLLNIQSCQTLSLSMMVVTSNTFRNTRLKFQGRGVDEICLIKDQFLISKGSWSSARKLQRMRGLWLAKLSYFHYGDDGHHNNNDGDGGHDHNIDDDGGDDDDYYDDDGGDGDG